MTSSVVANGVNTAFAVLTEMGLVKTIVFSSSAARTFDLATGVIDESVTDTEIIGVVESIEGSGQMLASPNVKVILNKANLEDGDEATVDYSRFDTFRVVELDKTYVVSSYTDNFYSIEISGVQK